MSHFLHATRPIYAVAADKDGVTLKRYGVKPRETEWVLAPSGAITWRKHTLRGENGESCYLVGRDGKLLWMGTGGDQGLVDMLVERIRAERKQK